MIDSIIAAQLRNSKRVVVPDLGSFIHKEGGQTVFMEFLKKDDGVLTAAIAREFGLDAAEAQAVAAEWALGVRRTVAGGKRYVIAGVGSLHADTNGLMVLEEEAGAAPFVAPVAAPVITPVFAPEPVVAPVAAPVITPVFAPEPVVAPVVPEPSLEPTWGSTIYKDTAPARQPELMWGAEPMAPRQPEPAPTPASRQPEPAFGFEPASRQPEPMPASRQPEPAFGFEPASCQPEPTPASRQPEPTPTPRCESVEEKSKAFTLNDLYSDPEDEDVPDLSQSSFNDRDYTAPSFNDSAYNQTSFNDAAFNGAATLNDAVYGGGTTLNDVYGTPEPARQEYSGGRAEYPHSKSEYAPSRPEPAASRHEHPADRFEGDDALRPPHVRRPSQIHSTHRRKPDLVLIIAIVAAVAAIITIIIGLSSNNASVVRRPIGGADTTAVQIDSAAMEMPLEE